MPVCRMALTNSPVCLCSRCHNSGAEGTARHKASAVTCAATCRPFLRCIWTEEAGCDGQHTYALCVTAAQNPLLVDEQRTRTHQERKHLQHEVLNNLTNSQG